MKKNPGYAPTEGGMEMKRNRVYGLRNPANRQSGSEIGTDANLLYGLRQGGKFESEIGTEENLLYGLRQGGKSESEICTEANLLYGLRQIPKEKGDIAPDVQHAGLSFPVVGGGGGGGGGTPVERLISVQYSVIINVYS